jgi:FkbM family methyltransferase
MRVASPPMLFRLARWMMRRDAPGAWRLWRALKDAGALNRVALYQLEGAARSAPLYVPLYRAESSWSEFDVRRYSTDLVAAAVRRIAEIGAAAVLFDCGADIGMIASALLRESPFVRSVVAFEPNAESFGMLSLSAALWPAPARAVNAAVGARSGRGRLTAPGPESDQHAFFIAEDANGPIEIRRIDDEEAPADCVVVIKIDVEGGEHDVVRGAIETLRRAPGFVVIFEAHPKVAARNGYDPSETLRLLRSIRPVSVEVAEFPDVVIDPDVPYFEQLGERRTAITNIVCASRDARHG